MTLHKLFIRSAKVSIVKALQFLLMQCLSTLALQRKHAKALFMLVLVLPMNQANCLNQLHNKKQH